MAEPTKKLILPQDDTVNVVSGDNIDEAERYEIDYPEEDGDDNNDEEDKDREILHIIEQCNHIDACKIGNAPFDNEQFTKIGIVLDKIKSQTEKVKKLTLGEKALLFSSLFKEGLNKHLEEGEKALAEIIMHGILIGSETMSIELLYREKILLESSQVEVDCTSLNSGVRLDLDEVHKAQSSGSNIITPIIDIIAQGIDSEEGEVALRNICKDIDSTTVYGEDLLTLFDF